MRYAEIDIMSVVNNPENRKQEKEKGLFNIDDLQKSIELYGQLQPIIVKPINDNEYKLLAGERRILALKLCQYESVKAVILEDDDLCDEDTVRRIENSCRKSLHPLDEAKEIAEAIQKDGVQVAAVTFGASASYCRKRAQLLSLIPDFKEMFFSDQLKLMDALELSRVQESIQKRILKNWDAYKYDVTRAIQNLRCDLSKACFDTTECVKCQNNTSTDNLLFEDLKLNTCLNEECFNAKKEKFIETSIKIYKEEQSIKGEEPIIFSEQWASSYDGINTAKSYDYDFVECDCPGAMKAMYCDGENAGKPVFVKKIEKDASTSDDSYEKRQKAEAEAYERFYALIKDNAKKVKLTDEQFQSFCADYIVLNMNWQGKRAFKNYEAALEEDFNSAFFASIALSLMNYNFTPDSPFFEKYDFLKKIASKTLEEVKKEVFEEKGVKYE